MVSIWVKHCGKRENAGNQHFLPFPQCFQKPSPSRSLKPGFCGEGFTRYQTTPCWNDP